jgi:hypothetical protein
MDVPTGKLVSNRSVYQIPCGDTGAGSLRAYAKILEPSRGSLAFGLAAELLKQCIAGDLLTSGWRLGAHRFDVTWIDGVPYLLGTPLSIRTFCMLRTSSIAP